MIKTSCNKNLKLLWISHLDPDLLSSIKKTVNNDFCRSIALEACLLNLADIELKIHFHPISPFGHLQGWVLLPRIVLGWKEGIGCSPPLRRTDPVIVLFHLKRKSESDFLLLFRHQGNFQKPPTSLSRGSKLIGLDRSYLMENPDYQKLRFTILKWAKPRADIYLLFMWSTRRSWIISFFAVRIWQFLLLCATWNASRLRWINNPPRCVTDRIFYHLQGELHKLKIRHKVQLTIALGFK